MSTPDWHEHPNPDANVLRTPDEWQAQPWCDRIVLDPDGWRGDRYGALPWDTPVTRAEYERRAALSTTGPKRRRDQEER